MSKSLTLIDPVRDLDRMASAMFPALSAAAVRAAGDRMMPVDWFDAEDRYILVADLPGVAADAIEVDLDGQILTVRAHRAQVEHDGARTVVRERAAGRWVRQVRLPRPVDAEKVSADYRDGVLTVTLPVAEASKPRRVSITAS